MRVCLFDTIVTHQKMVEKNGSAVMCMISSSRNNRNDTKVRNIRGITEQELRHKMRL